MAGVALVLGSYNFSLSSLSDSRLKVNPTPFGSIGLSDANELINVVFSNINLSSKILIFTSIALLTLYVDKKNFFPFATSNNRKDFAIRNMFLFLVIVIAGNQVNYKLILLIPLLVIVMNKYDPNLLVVTLLGLLTIGQHTIIRNVLLFVLTVLLTKYIINDLRFKINNRAKAIRN
jgi:hypothetical protein